MSSSRGTFAHPYMANSTPAAVQQMLEEIGISDVEDLFVQIPGDHRLSRELKLEPALSSEYELRRHVSEILAKNASCADHLNFLGAGCWQHYVPALCDQIIARTEFATSVWGTAASDHGRNQAWFEFASQLGELVGMDFVGLPVYSWGCAAGSALRMASRMTSRSRVLVPRATDPERLSVIRGYCGAEAQAGSIEVVTFEHDPQTGQADVADLRAKLDADVAAVYLEVPSYLGVVEGQAELITAFAHEYGAQAVVGVDPISLGVLAPPSHYGADIVVGPTQPLGVHMNCGGGVGGFIATRDEESYARQFPTLQVSICDTIVPGERTFGMTLFEQSSYGSRENGRDWTGNSVYLWAIANAVYMSMMGPSGFLDIGTTILRRSHDAAQQLAKIQGVSVPWATGFFKEFVVNFDGTGKSVRQINEALLELGIFGGKDLTQEQPELGNSALYCVTEVHSPEDIDRLTDALRKVLA